MFIFARCFFSFSLFFCLFFIHQSPNYASSSMLYPSFFLLFSSIAFSIKTFLNSSLGFLFSYFLSGFLLLSFFYIPFLTPFSTFITVSLSLSRPSLSNHSIRLGTRRRTQLIYHLQVAAFLLPHFLQLRRVVFHLSYDFFSCVSCRLPSPYTVVCYLSALYCQNALSKQMLNNFSAPKRQASDSLSLFLSLSQLVTRSVSLALLSICPSLSVVCSDIPRRRRRGCCCCRCCSCR